MDLSKQTMKRLLQIVTFGILLYCGVEHFDVVLDAFGFLWNLASPFLVGAALAFVFNVPMRMIERHLFPKNRKMQKWRRPLAYLLTLLAVIGVAALIMVVVVPELADTITMIVTQIPIALKQFQKWLEQLPEQYPALEPVMADMTVDWSKISADIVSFIQKVVAGIVNSGVGLFSGIINGVVMFVVAFTFSIYVLFQKEKLGSQVKQILYALLPEKVTKKILEVAVLSEQVFSHFLSGQCLEAVILGTMFVIAMSIFRMPYAMLTGMVIAVTALIPIFGAFIGCVVGMILIVMVNPIQAVWFFILFQVLQQIEGNLIYPHVVGGSVGLPSIWVLVAVTVGGNLFGVVGMLVFIPICSVLYALFRSFVKRRLREREVPAEKWEKKKGL